jgi:hypothetical protein
MIRTAVALILQDEALGVSKQAAELIGRRPYHTNS